MKNFKFYLFFPSENTIVSNFFNVMNMFYKGAAGSGMSGYCVRWPDNSSA